MNSEKYNGMPLELKIEANEHGDYIWSVTFSSSDFKKETRLGYSASGSLSAFSNGEHDFLIKVRDEDREVWTEMPLDHRDDIRNGIISLLSGATACLNPVN